VIYVGPVLASVPVLCWNAFPERTAGRGPPRSSRDDRRAARRSRPVCPAAVLQL